MIVILVVVVVIGILISVIGLIFLKWLKIDDLVVVGFFFGGIGYVVGIGIVFWYGFVVGVMGGLVIGVIGIFYVFVSFIVVSLILS